MMLGKYRNSLKIFLCQLILKQLKRLWLISSGSAKQSSTINTERFATRKSPTKGSQTFWTKWIARSEVNHFLKIWSNCLSCFLLWPLKWNKTSKNSGIGLDSILPSILCKRIRAMEKIGRLDISWESVIQEKWFHSAWYFQPLKQKSDFIKSSNHSLTSWRKNPQLSYQMKTQH